MSDDDRFNPKYVDEPKYKYTHSDDTIVKVSIGEFQNGQTVGVYHYDADGTRLNYYRFRINSVDRRKLVAELPEKAEEVPDAVAVALHAGGWEIANMSAGNIAPDENDPVEVQILDMRDGFREYANQADASLLIEYFESMARAVEIGLVLAVSVQQMGQDPDEAIEEAAQDVDYADMMGNKEHVEGSFLNAVYPETQRSTEEHDRIVNCLEYARDMYRAGEDFGEQFEKAYSIGEP